MKKRNLLIVMMSVFVMILASCGTNSNSSTSNTDNQTEQSQMSNQDEAQKEFTVEELAQYNGKDGNKAYIAVDGVVYDVTDHPAWKDGGHNGIEAGQDLTDEIKNHSPHGVKVLEGLTVVGTLK